MKLDVYGRPSFEEDEIISQLYKDPALDITHIKLHQGAGTTFNRAIQELFLDDPQIKNTLQEYVDIAEFDQSNQQHWHMPAEYRTLDIHSYIITQCQSPAEKIRAYEELDQYDARDMLPLLRYMKYLVDIMRKHNIVWGVGRGSSVSSYVLYKIGIHRIDSLTYNLDWREFLR